MGSVRLERARDRTDRAHRRVLALTFGPDFIHWRRSGESWPSVWPGRRLFFFTIRRRRWRYGVDPPRAGSRPDGQGALDRGGRRRFLFSLIEGGER